MSDTGPIDKFPTVWLTYGQRIKLDLANAYAMDENDSFFNDAYLDRITAQEKQLADWVIKLFLVQIALTAFQVAGFVTSEGSLSIFGITLKQATGVKEIILTLSATVALVTWIMMVSRDTCQTIIDTLLELNFSADFLPYAKVAGSTPFSVKLLIPRLHDQFVFATKTNKASMILFVLLLLVLYLIVFAFALAVNVFFFLNIYWHPTLGVWSSVVLAYVSLVVLFGVLFFVRFYVPQPHSDSRILKEIEALKEVDEKLYRRMLDDVYGPKSKFRRKRWFSYFRGKK